MTDIYTKRVQSIPCWVNFPNPLSPTMWTHSFPVYLLSLWDPSKKRCQRAVPHLLRGAASRAAGRSSAAEPARCSPPWRTSQHLRAFFNKGLFLNVPGHLKGYAGHFLPVGLEEGSTQAKMFDVWCTVISFMCSVAFICWSMFCYQLWPWCGPGHWS